MSEDLRLARLEIELRGDRLGVGSFDDSAAHMMAILTTMLGPPDHDDIPDPGESIYPGTYSRTVQWNDPRSTFTLMLEPNGRADNG